jgi:hypothetical protein
VIVLRWDKHVRDEVLELLPSRRGEDKLHALVELVDAEPAACHGFAQQLSGALALGVGGPPRRKSAFRIGHRGPD